MRDSFVPTLPAELSWLIHSREEDRNTHSCSSTGMGRSSSTTTNPSRPKHSLHANLALKQTSQPNAQCRLQLSIKLWSFFPALSAMRMRVICPGSCEAATALSGIPSDSAQSLRRNYEKICFAHCRI